jgi:hypothetical protein
MKRKHRDSQHYEMVHGLSNSIQPRVSQDYRRLVGEAPNLVDYFLSVSRGESLIIERSKERIRDLDL